MVNCISFVSLVALRWTILFDSEKKYVLSFLRFTSGSEYPYQQSLLQLIKEINNIRIKKF